MSKIKSVESVLLHLSANKRSLSMLLSEAQQIRCALLRPDRYVLLNRTWKPVASCNKMSKPITPMTAEKMINPIALQDHITNNFTDLTAHIICPLERLQNMRHDGVFDTGIWISPRDHFTVIYSDVSNSLEDCSFEIGSHGPRAKSLLAISYGRKSKYTSALSLTELNSILHKIAAQLPIK